MYGKGGRWGGFTNSPAEDSKDEVEHEEGSDDNERNKIYPIK